MESNKYIKNPQILVDDDGFYILNNSSSVFHIVKMPGILGKTEEGAIKEAIDNVYEKNHRYGIHSLIFDSKLNPGEKQKMDSLENNRYKDYSWFFVIKNLDTNEIQVTNSSFGKTLVLTQ